MRGAGFEGWGSEAARMSVPEPPVAGEAGGRE